VWGAACLAWWDEKGFKIKGFDLEWAYREVKRVSEDFSWLWFPKCFRKAQGFGFLERRDNSTDPDIIDQERDCIHIGEFLQDKPHGFGVTMTTTSIRFGTFVEGKGCGKITKLWADGEKFEGTYNNDRRNGIGRYQFADGTAYQGDFKDGPYHGAGSMTWPDGFKYEGVWDHGQPKESPAATHPGVKDCLDKELCTIVFTNKTLSFAQTRHLCEQCDQWFCDACKKSCHSNLLHESWKTEWFVGSYCECGDTCTKRAVEPVKKKKLNVSDLSAKPSLKINQHLITCRIKLIV